MPAVMRSNFSFKLPVHGCRFTGIKFWRKSPAVGLIKRHCPLEALRETEVNARVAVLSRGCDSAADDGCSVTPAPETGTGVEGLAVSVGRITSPAWAADCGGADTEEDAAAGWFVEAGGAETGEDAATGWFVEATALDAARVTKTVVTELHCALAGAGEVAATIARAVETDDAASIVGVAETDAAPPPPNLKA
jgi:hypothetical protein